MIAWNGYNTAVCWQLRDTDISPIFTPIYHAGGLAAFLIPIFAAGGTIVLHRNFDVHEVLRAIERERCTVALGVPTIFKMLLDAPEFSQVDLSHIRWFISGGAPLPIDLIAEYQRRGLVLKQGYGLTEVGVNCFAMSSEDATRKAGSIGRPLMFTEARLRDANGNDARPVKSANCSCVVRTRARDTGMIRKRQPPHWTPRVGFIPEISPAATKTVFLHRRPLEGYVHQRRRERLSHRGGS